MRELIKKRLEVLTGDCYQTQVMIQKTFPAFDNLLERMSLILSDINLANREYLMELKRQDEGK